jgi:diguanylate cyclase (GGDEF)-like protein
MLHRLAQPKELTAQETRQIILPAQLAVVLACVILIAYGSISFANDFQRLAVIALGVLGFIYGMVALILRIRLSPKNLKLKWPLEIFDSALSIAAFLVIHHDVIIILYVILILVAAIKSIIWDRFVAYGFLILSIAGYIIILAKTGSETANYIELIAISLLGAMVVELVQTLAVVNAHRINRLQTINDFARQISSSLEHNQVLTIVGAAIQKAIEADTYFLGLSTGDNRMYFHLLYDDGQFFPPTEISLDGTLSGWVVRNHRSLFIPDLRNDVNLEGVQVILTGNNRDNACWMGVPMRAGSIDGIIAVASYSPNAFDRTALELLENLAQHAALALDNANHHSEVEAKSHLDSLTEVYNHGYIVRLLREEIEKAQESAMPLSLVMLDIDYFKQYNDNFGHQVGDEVLIRLTQAIRQHIKSTDAVGRWGGEEFTIILPGANGTQAMQVARRVQETVRTLSIRPHNGKTLPFPTVSQGVAVYPAEAADSDRLIHLADKRLYIAKSRGRNQIEPDEAHWNKVPG